MAAKIRVVHVIVGLNVGGAELMLKRLIEARLESCRVDHEVVTLTEVGVVGAQLQAIGIKVHALGMHSSLSVPRALFRLVRYLRRNKPTIVQTWMYHADLLGGLAAWLAGNRNIVWGVRTTNVQAGGTPSTTVIMHVCSYLSRWVPRVIVCAANASRRAHEEVGYDKSKMTVIPNGFDLSSLVATADESLALRAASGIHPDKVVVGMLGRFNPAKDQKNFVEAATRVALAYPNVQFLMVGRGLDQGNAELKSWIDGTGFADRFVLLGERSDVAVCLRAMDMFCLSSRTEGFPNVVGEAMAVGLPCVVTDVGDAAMLVADTGVVVPKENPEALAAGLEEMLKLSQERRIALGEKARQRITSEFTIERARQRFEAIYNSLNEDQRGKSRVCVDS
jgi:glycosyltransferase involved in cell wall biosynthesis